MLTPRLSYTKHVRQKAHTAKFALNNIWGKLFDEASVPVRAKMDVFRSAVRSVLCYAAPCWGWREYGGAEGVQLMFIRRLFRLPRFAQNYILHLETGLDTVSAFTLEALLEYLLRVARLQDSRLPRIVAREVISKNVSWARHLDYLSTELDVHNHLDSLDYKIIRAQADALLGEFTKSGRVHKKFWRRALDSENFTLYKELDPSVKPLSLIEDTKMDLGASRWLFKLRGQLLHLNGKTLSH
ncbi:hypothetical protein GE061_002409 [Apolygus lucorum]|uniref:Uncharacterized protein n=1 Tax=Apolygus lucorum TaxID=248454 RepID=A0A8S9X6H7_APOLU|nr:hypothetical protein GE061_002409 [Apolygus lucorum]